VDGWRCESKAEVCEPLTADPPYRADWIWVRCGFTNPNQKVKVTEDEKQAGQWRRATKQSKADTDDLAARTDLVKGVAYLWQGGAKRQLHTILRPVGDVPNQFDNLLIKDVHDLQL
jgi:hypothetical protein